MHNFKDKTKIQPKNKEKKKNQKEKKYIKYYIYTRIRICLSLRERHMLIIYYLIYLSSDK